MKHTYCCFLFRQPGHCDRSPDLVSTSVLSPFESGSEELNGPAAVVVVSSLTTEMVVVGQVEEVAQVGEAGLAEVVDATWTRFTTYLQTLQNTIIILLNCSSNTVRLTVTSVVHRIHSLKLAKCKVNTSHRHCKNHC